MKRFRIFDDIWNDTASGVSDFLAKAGEVGIFPENVCKFHAVLVPGLAVKIEMYELLFAFAVGKSGHTVPFLADSKTSSVADNVQVVLVLSNVKGYFGEKLCKPFFKL